MLACSYGTNESQRSVFLFDCSRLSLLVAGRFRDRSVDFLIDDGGVKIQGRIFRDSDIPTLRQELSLLLV